MSTNQTANKDAARILASFLAVCILFAPAQSSEKADTEVAVTPTQQPSVSPKVETEFSLLNRKPKLAAKAWYSGKKILSAHELSYLLHEAGFRGKEHRLAWIVAMGESTGRPKAFNGHCCHGRRGGDGGDYSPSGLGLGNRGGEQQVATRPAGAHPPA